MPSSWLSGALTYRSGCDAALPGKQPRTANGLSSPSRPEIPITGGRPHDDGRPVAPGLARAAAPVLLLGQQIIGVGLDEQLHERRMHDALPVAGGDARCGPCPSP